MIPMPSGVRVWIATGHTDMRRGMQGLALQVQEQLKRDPHGGDLYLFRGRRGDLAKILWHDGVGLSLYSPTTWLHTAPPSAGSEHLDSVVWRRAAARSASWFHRLRCLAGGFGPGVSYR